MVSKHYLVLFPITLNNVDGPLIQEKQNKWLFHTAHNNNVWNPLLQDGAMSTE